MGVFNYFDFCMCNNGILSQLIISFFCVLNKSDLIGSTVILTNLPTKSTTLAKVQQMSNFLPFLPTKKNE
jgi:hypothetical protein